MSLEAPVISRKKYINGRKYCAGCGHFIITENLLCDCGKKYRTSPKRSKYKANRIYID